VWAQHLGEPKNDGFGGSQNPHKFGLSAWLSFETVGLTVFQTHIYMGSTLGRV